MRIDDRNELMMFGLIVAGKTLFVALIVAERQGSVHRRHSPLIVADTRQMMVNGDERFPCIAGQKFPTSLRSVSAVSAWRLDAEQLTEINLGDGLQDRGCGGVAQTVRQGVIPGRIFGLQVDQHGNGIVPALQAGAPIGWPPVTNNRRCLVGLVARAMAGLAFGIAEWVFAFGFATSGHGVFLRYVTQYRGWTGRVAARWVRALPSRTTGTSRNEGVYFGAPMSLGVAWFGGRPGPFCLRSRAARRR